LTQWAWGQAGVTIGPDTYTQVKQGHIIEARNGYKAREELNAAAGRAEILNDGLDPRSFEPDGPLGENEALAYAFQAVEGGSATPNGAEDLRRPGEVTSNDD